MSKPKAVQTPRIESRPIAEKAYLAAYDVRSGLKSYNEYHADMMKRLNEASADIERNCAYGTITERAGNIVAQVSQLTQNMRLDLIVKYAARAEMGEAVLSAIRDQLTEEEEARVVQILGS
jgi:hypothetical protein